MLPRDTSDAERRQPSRLAAGLHVELVSGVPNEFRSVSFRFRTRSTVLLAVAPSLFAVSNFFAASNKASTALFTVAAIMAVITIVISVLLSIASNVSASQAAKSSHSANASIHNYE
jgi:hypothetical protein